MLVIIGTGRLDRLERGVGRVEEPNDVGNEAGQNVHNEEDGKRGTDRNDRDRLVDPRLFLKADKDRYAPG